MNDAERVRLGDRFARLKDVLGGVGDRERSALLLRI